MVGGILLVTDVETQMQKLADGARVFFNTDNKLTIKDIINLYQKKLIPEKVENATPQNLYTGTSPLANYELGQTIDNFHYVKDAYVAISTPLKSVNTTNHIGKLNIKGTMNVGLSCYWQEKRYGQEDGSVDFCYTNSQLAEIGGRGSDNENAFYLDGKELIGGGKNVLKFVGWHCSNQAYGKNYHFLILFDKSKNHELSRVAVKNIQRDDVRRAKPNIYNSKYSGFIGCFPCVSDEYYNDELILISRYTADRYGNNDPLDYWSDSFRLNFGSRNLYTPSNYTTDTKMMLILSYDDTSGKTHRLYANKGATTKSGNTFDIDNTFYCPDINLNSPNNKLQLLLNSSYDFRTWYVMNDLQVLFFEAQSPTNWKQLDIDFPDGKVRGNMADNSGISELQFSLPKSNAIIPKRSLVYFSFDLSFDNITILGDMTDDMIEADASPLIYTFRNSKTNDSEQSSSFYSRSDGDIFFSSDSIAVTLDGYISATKNDNDTFSFTMEIINANSNVSIGTWAISNFKMYYVTAPTLDTDTSCPKNAYTNLANAFRAYYKTQQNYTLSQMIALLNKS